MKKILVVDDEPDVLEFLKIRVQIAGFEAILAKNGTEAFEKAKKGNPDLIILDVMMPVFSGYEVCKMLKEDESTKDIPVIMLTAKSTVGDVEEGAGSGAAAYVTKPYDWDYLLNKINKLIL